MNIGSIADVLTRLALGLGIGFTTGLTGIGAGVLGVPSLIYIVGLSPVSAVATGLLYSTLIKAHGAFEHLRLKNVRKRTALYISLGGVPAVVVISLAITRLKEIYGSSVDFAVKITIGVVMLLTWILMLISFIKSRRSNSEDFYTPPEKFPFRRKVYGVAAGAGIGVLTGATSIGGGVLLVPVLVAFFNLSPRNTVGTSALIGIIIAGAGSLAYSLGGNLNPVVAVTMFLGSIPGVILGCRVSVKIPHRILSSILFLVITISLIAMFAGIKH